MCFSKNRNIFQNKSFHSSHSVPGRNSIISSDSLRTVNLPDDKKSSPHFPGIVDLGGENDACNGHVSYAKGPTCCTTWPSKRTPLCFPIAPRYYRCFEPLILMDVNACCRARKRNKEGQEDGGGWTRGMSRGKDERGMPGGRWTCVSGPLSSL